MPGLIDGTPAPVVKADGLFGHPVVRFKNFEGRVRIFSANPTGVHLDWTLLYVGRMTGPQPGRLVNSIYPGGGNLLVGWWNGFQDVCYDQGFMAPNTQVGWTTDWKMYSADGNSTIPRTRFFGGAGPTLGLLGSGSTGLGWGNCFAVSGYGPAGDNSESCDCELAEAMLYNRQLGGLERQSLETYLYGRWITGTDWVTPLDYHGRK